MTWHIVHTRLACSFFLIACRVAAHPDASCSSDDPETCQGVPPAPETLPTADSAFTVASDTAVNLISSMWKQAWPAVIDKCRKDNETYHLDPRFASLLRDEKIAHAKSSLCGQNVAMGFIAGLTPYAGIPAGMVGSLVMQAEAACVVAAIRGHNVDSEETGLLIRTAMAGEAGVEVLHRAASIGANAASQRLGTTMLRHVPSRAFRSINKALWPILGRHFVTKGSVGLISVTKLVPLVGSILGSSVGGAIDWVACRQVIDFAQSTVFPQIYQGQDELKKLLVDKGFDEVTGALLNAGYDISMESACALSSASEISNALNNELPEAFSVHKLALLFKRRCLGDAYRGQDELKKLLVDEGFDEVTGALLDDAGYDISMESVCALSSASEISNALNNELPEGFSVRKLALLFKRRCLGDAYRGQDDLKKLLVDEGFDEVTGALLDAGYDISMESVCALSSASEISNALNNALPEAFSVRKLALLFKRRCLGDASVESSQKKLRDMLHGNDFDEEVTFLLEAGFVADSICPVPSHAELLVAGVKPGRALKLVKLFKIECVST